MATASRPRGRQRSKSERVARGTTAFAWKYRAELTAFPAAPAVVYSLVEGLDPSGFPADGVSGPVGQVAASLAGAGWFAPAAGLTAAVGSLNAVRASEPFQARRKGREVGRALVTANLARVPKRPGESPRPPVMRRPSRTPAGWSVLARVPDHSAALAFEKFLPIVEDKLCAAVTVQQVAPPAGSVSKSVARAREIAPGVAEGKPAKKVPRGWVELKIRDRDPLADVSPAWPHLGLVSDVLKPGAAGLDLWDGIFAGVNEDGEPVNLVLPQRNLLIGGLPGGGKSCFLQEICGAAALDPNVRLSVIDPSGGVELGRWSGVAARVAENADEAVDLLKLDNAEMELALEELRDGGRRNVMPGDVQHLMVVDEIAALTRHSHAATKKECGQKLADRVGRGRKVGYITVAASLKPTSETVPTFLSMLMEYRLAFRCSKTIMSDTILGDGWGGQGFDASDAGIISSADQGVGLLMAGGATPVRIKTAFLNDSQLDRIKAFAVLLRAANPQARAAVSARPSVPVLSKAPSSVPVSAVPVPRASTPARPGSRRNPEPGGVPSAEENFRRAQSRKSRNRPPKSHRRLHPVPSENSDSKENG